MIRSSQKLSDLEMTQQVRDISRRLRSKKNILERAKWEQRWDPYVPSIFYGQSPTGQKKHPIIAFKTPLCDRYLAGVCIPCGYSGRYFPARVQSNEKREWLLAQLEWLCFNFYEVLGCGIDCSTSEPVTMQLAGASSFFRDEEISPEMRETILLGILKEVRKKGVNLQVVLETRPEHFIEAEESGELSRLKPLLADLQVSVNFGYEASNHFLREIVFQKGISEELFLEAIQIAKRRKLDPGAFAFAGGYLLTSSESLLETGKTLSFFKQTKIFPNLMIPNLQAFTLPDLLYEFRFYRLPEPYFVLDLLDLLYEYIPSREDGITTFSWFLGGFEADPPPRVNIFNNPRMRTSKVVAKAIFSCVYQLMESHNWVDFRKESRRLRERTDHKYHVEDMANEISLNYSCRMSNAIDLATQRFDEYCKRITNAL